MATLLVRNLDDTVVARLKARARAHGRSAEAEHRLILEQALRPEQQQTARTKPMTGKELLAMMRSGPTADLEIPDLDGEVRPAKFD